MIDIDRSAALRHGLRAAMFGALACVSALVGMLFGSVVASYIVLSIGAVTFIGELFTLSADLRQTRLLDDDLHKRS